MSTEQEGYQSEWNTSANMVQIGGKPLPSSERCLEILGTLASFNLREGGGRKCWILMGVLKKTTHQILSKHLIARR